MSSATAYGHKLSPPNPNHPAPGSLSTVCAFLSSPSSSSIPHLSSTLSETFLLTPQLLCPQTSNLKPPSDFLLFLPSFSLNLTLSPSSNDPLYRSPSQGRGSGATSLDTNSIYMNMYMDFYKKKKKWIRSFSVLQGILIQKYSN